MGCYMNGFGESYTGKADVLEQLHGAKRLEVPKFISPSTGKVTLCVVANQMFEAVAVAYSEQEFKDFTREDDERPKEYLSIDCDVVRKYASGFDLYVAEE